jgi:UDP-3-O-[3-hydroxymyristoyl] glucosamine N-acyltransferase
VNDKEKNEQRREFARGRLKLNEPIYDNRYGISRFYGDSLHSNVVRGEKVWIGKYCTIRSGTVIGESGFSFGFDENNIPIPIRHTGGVIIGNHVNIGCNCTIMRGTIEDTIIEDYCQFDNLIHVAHNVKIGKGTCVADHASINGSAQIGEFCWIGPGAIIMNKIKIGRMVLVGMGANVIEDVPNNAVVAGNPAKILYFHDGSIHPGAIGRRQHGA